MISRDHELKLCAGHPRLRPNHVIVGPLLLLLRYVWVFTFSCQFGFVQKKYLKLHMVYHCCCHKDDHLKIYRYTTFSDIHTCMQLHTHTFCLRSTDLHVSIFFLAASCSPGAVGSRPTGSSHPARELRGRDGRRHCLNWYVSRSQRVIDGFVWFVCMYINIYMCVCVYGHTYVIICFNIYIYRKRDIVQQ
jgi:hypothetical protein